MAKKEKIWLAGYDGEFCAFDDKVAAIYEATRWVCESGVETDVEILVAEKVAIVKPPTDPVILYLD